MANIFDRMRAVLAQKQSTAADLERALSAAVQDHERAVARVAGLEASRGSPETLATEGALPKLRLTLQEARDDAIDTANYVAELGRRHAEAAAAEAEAARRERYAEAKRARDAAVKVFLSDYPKAARALAHLVRTVAEADALVVAANADAPAGAAVLEAVEAVRDLPPLPHEEMRPEDEQVWRFDDEDAFTVPANAKIESRDGEHFARMAGGRLMRVVKRTMRTHRWLPGLPGAPGSRLHQLTLPGLRHGDPAIFAVAPQHDGWGVPVPPHPLVILERMDALATAKSTRRPDREPETRRQLLPLEPAQPAQEPVAQVA